MARILCLTFFVIIQTKFVHLYDGFRNTTSPCTDSKHMFLSPGVISPGGTSRACLSRFHPDGPARFTLTLYSEDVKISSSVRELAAGDGGCLDINVPQNINTKAQLVVSAKYPEHQCTWEQKLSVRVAGGRTVTILSERARYRPGEAVRVRLIVLKADLTPAHGVIIDEVWLETPLGTRAASWQRQRTKMGITQLQHDLDVHAPTGRWTLRARLADGSQGAAAFWVANYELPPFQLSVKHPQKVLRTSERLVWTVCVRYPWTEAVEGMLVIRIRGAPGDAGPGIRTALQIRSPRACHRHAAAARRVGLDTVHSPDVVIADFSFREEGTHIWQNTTVVSQVVDKAVSLEFLSKHRAVSPGLPYKIKIKATRFDDKPASNEPVRVCRYQTNNPRDEKPENAMALCNVEVTDSTGILRVMFTTDEEGNSSYYRFEATLQNDTSTFATPLILPIERSGSVHAVMGPLKPDPNGNRTFIPLYLNIKNITKALTVHFVVITRGGIIYRWGTTTQCPVANSAIQIQTVSRNSPCHYNPNDSDQRTNRNQYNMNDTDALQSRHILRVMLPIKVTHQMCPDSHFIAYFYYNGELVTASKHLETDGCFNNKVELKWESWQTAPGSSTSLQISTPGPAHCALTAINSATKWIQPMENVKDVLLGGLKRLIDGHRNLTIYDAAGECFFTSENLGAESGDLTTFWFAEAGIRLVGGNKKKLTKCEPGPAPLIADEITIPRSDFSESWLWRVIGISGNVSSTTTTARVPDSITRYETSAVCLSRFGLAVSSPTVLQVFREFFIHADGPQRLRNGDASIIQYRIFNYLYEPISVQIQILTDPHIEGPQDYVEAACINARSSIARRVEIRARLVGNARVSVRAKSVVDGNCANVTKSKFGVSDEVIIKMTVDPEGIPVKDHKSILLCARGSHEGTTSQVSWSWPPVRAVPGTESLMVWALGDIVGPLLADADDLVQLPRGCGEQNMARLATNLLALEQLDPKSAAAIKARAHVARGFTRQLHYIHPQGGFSAFGGSDATPSTWLTAFTVRYLRKAHRVLTPGLPAPPALDKAEKWLLDQQMENGCFRNEGQVFHRELKGGLDEEGEIASVALTAYVITSLLDTSVLPARLVRNTLSCLRALPLKSKSPNKIYAQSLLAYTFVKLKKYEEDIRRGNEASLRDNADGLQQDEEIKELVELLRMAKRKGDLVWWETGSLATSIEATSYALLALADCPVELRETSCSHDAHAAVRWLSMHRNSAGGFVSTQDTLVALEAITSWSAVHPVTATDLRVSVHGSGTKTVELKTGDTIPEVVNMSGNDVSIHVEGTGCALIQATRSYNAYNVEQSLNKLLSVQVTVHTDGVYDCYAGKNGCYCAAIVEACVVWAGDFPEMALLELSLPGGYGADAALLYAQLKDTDPLLRRIELSPNSGRATLYLSTRISGASSGAASGATGGHQCYNMHAVGPAVKTKPTYVRVMDYYNPEINFTQTYTIPEDCPPRLSHESNTYSPSENLYNKAKALNSDEIVISSDYTFDDIPEGIPLEDPLYDNLETKYIVNLTSDRIWNNKPSNIKMKDLVKGKDKELKIYENKNDKNIQTDKQKLLTEQNGVEREQYAAIEVSTTPSVAKVSSNNDPLSENPDTAIDDRQTNIPGANINDNRSHYFKINSEISTKNSDDSKKLNLPYNEKDSKKYELDEINAINANKENGKIINVISRANGNSRNAEITSSPYFSMEKNKHQDEINLRSATFYPPYVQENSKIISDKLNFESDELNHSLREGKEYAAEINDGEFMPEKKESENEIAKLDENPHRIVIGHDKYTRTHENMLSDPYYSKQTEKPQPDPAILENPVMSTANDGVKEVDNPNLADFHVIDSDKDLEVPPGLEGPVPAVALPPPFKPRGFVGNPYNGPQFELPWNWRVPSINSRIISQNRHVYFHHQAPNRRYLRYRRFT